jgi:hypothetical protein
MKTKLQSKLQLRSNSPQNTPPASPVKQSPGRTLPLNSQQ